MFYLTPTKLLKSVDISGFDRVLNIHSGYLLCDTSYTVNTISKGRMHSLLMTNGLRDESPLIYQDNDRIFVVEGSAMYEVKLDKAHDLNDINLSYDIRRVVKLEHGLLICHMAGCLLVSDDLQSRIWSIDDERISDVVWRDEELRVYYDEHTSVVIDPETGEEATQTSAKSTPHAELIGDAIVINFPVRKKM